MATALQKQLAAIAATSTHQLDLKAQKSAHAKSLLFDTKTAASQSLETIYQLCYAGYRELCALDARFLPFATTLFSEQSKVEDRAHMTAKENSRLNSALETFIMLAGSRLLLKPAEKALEWLVRRFRIHEHNTECLVFTYLPYHDSPQFVALLSILPPHPPPSLRFLAPYIPSPTNPPRRVVAYTAINTPVFFDAFQSHVARVLRAGHHTPHLLSFWSGVTIEAIHGTLGAVTSGRRDMKDQKTEVIVLKVLPVLNGCMQAEYGPDAVAACYTIIMMLVTQARLGDKVLDRLSEAVLLAYQEVSVLECLACLAVIAEERSTMDFSTNLSKALLRIPQIVEKLFLVSNQCHVERLVLACALGALHSMPSTDEKDIIFLQLLKSKLLSHSRSQIVMRALVLSLQDSEEGSEKHDQFLRLTGMVIESKDLLDSLQTIAEQESIDLESLGLVVGGSLQVDQIHASDLEDEEMLDIDSQVNEEPLAMQIPTTLSVSFLDPRSDDNFAQILSSFERAVMLKQSQRFLDSAVLDQAAALQQTRYMSFLTRVWCASHSVDVRAAALKAFGSAITGADTTAYTLQHLVPYLLYALGDSAPLVRRAAASCIATLSEKTAMKSTDDIWGAKDLYGTSKSRVTPLSAKDISILLSSMLEPILEECIMDSEFVTPAMRNMLEGAQVSNSHAKLSFKSQLRISILSFLSSHIGRTPLLRVRLRLLPISSFTGKISEPARTEDILPLIQQWSTLTARDVITLCQCEGITIEGAERGHIGALIPRDVESTRILLNVLVGFPKERALLISTTFDHVKSTWRAQKSDSRLLLAQCLLELALKSGSDSVTRLSHECALDTLRSVKLDSAILGAFLTTIPPVVQMPDKPLATKRRRTSRSELARGEMTSEHTLKLLLQRLTLVLELVEASSPEKHPSLFKNLFGILGEMHPLKQQSGSDLVYLHSIILGSLTPMVNTLMEQPNSAEYQSAIRADLLIDCIRRSTSPQVQNSALLLLATLASWVPDLILHNLMPIFTFLGSTLLRQQDDYSAHVVDKTISRVVPQLAASLRSKQRNFLTGVSDLLLSFNAAFEHIPLHRRLKLFSELARTLGPEDSLSAIIALLADRYHSNNIHRKFSTDLLLLFDPVHTLDAFKGYLDLVSDAVGPRRRVTDTLFGLSEKQPAQVESAIKNLLSCLADLATEERLQAHVTRAFRQKTDPNRPRQVFAIIVEASISLAQKVSGSPKLYDCCRLVLANCLDLLPTADLVKSTQLLLSNMDSQVQIAAIKAIELRAGTTTHNDHKSAVALISFLPNIEYILEQVQEADLKITSISCIDRIVERFGKRDIAAVLSVAETISGPQSLSSNDDRIRILSLICLTSVVDVLNDEALSLLPKCLPTAFDYLLHAIEESKTGLHNAVYAFLSNVVERLGYVFAQDHLITALELSHRSAGADLEDPCDESRRSFYHNIAGYLGSPEVFIAINSTWPHAIGQGFEAAFEQLSLLRSTVDIQSRARLIKASSILFHFLLEAFKLRPATESHNFAKDEIQQLDDVLIESVIAMTLKLNDATFRPFFVRLIDQEGPKHATTFLRFLAAFFGKFKSIVTSYSSYIIEHTAATLSHMATSDPDLDLCSAMLSVLCETFQHDQDGFWHSPSHYTTILAPLLSLLTLPSAATSTPANPTNLAIPTIVDFAIAASSSTDAHRDINAVLLRYMRAEEAHTRLATVLCEQALTRRLGEEWLVLLPEMLPFISELREDSDEMVERETQRWITGMEEVLGESLEDAPIWTRNPFAPEGQRSSTPFDSKQAREKDEKPLVTIFDDSQLMPCPTDSPLLHCTPRPRPSPIYQDKHHEEYWTFLKSVPDLQPSSRPPPSRCPSLVSGGTLSSRNSSTRSTRSSILEPIDDRNNNVHGVCLVPECSGLCFRDVNAHTRITHLVEQRIELCPVKSCERHFRGFMRAGDCRRHALTHFRGSLACGFCEEQAVSFSQASDRVGLFLTHLVKHHGVQGVQVQDHNPGGEKLETSRRKRIEGSPVAICTVCSEPFTAQVLYEHLQGCVLRQLARNEDSEALDVHDMFEAESKSSDHHVYCSDKAHSTSVNEEIPGFQDTREEESLEATLHSIEVECTDIAELTASSRCLSLTSSKAVESSEEETDWTEDATSRESSPGVSQLSRSLSPAKRKVVDSIMQQFQQLFNQNLRTHTPSGSSSGSSYNESAGWSSNASTYSNASFVSRKRSLSGGGSTPPNDEDDSNKRRRPDSKILSKSNVSELRFACPYYKRNPGRHPTFTSCRDPGFTSIARLKEHLYRRHLLPPQCHRCCTTFSNDVLLREHQRDVRGCEVQERTPLEGFDKDQERRLKSKKRSQTYQDEEQKWKGVYRILFPDDGEADMPSPYIEYQPCTGEIAEASPMARFQEFSRLELPRLVRRTLETVVEQEAQPLEDRLKEQLVDIVKQCQTQLVTMFQASAGPVSPSVPTSIPTPQPANPNAMIPLAVFEGFDSLPLRTVSLPCASTEPPPSHPDQVLETHSTLLDSCYNSTWPSSTSLNHGVSVPSSISFDVAFHQAARGSEFLDLGGYYGLFADRAASSVDVRTEHLNLNLNSPTGWSFMGSGSGTSGLGDIGPLDGEWSGGVAQFP